ncbi:hypothetical protein HPB47_010665 [Ixodes persulcatus]|uniref:Uncharacterized protein n=1 Tax=Ixodes persulcatus TaxID=34615 RepID=A0AC60NYE8_IXOPE|nr:hypothetical protein HPB47_010665 [Ixodes persulcatus]
MQVFAVLGNRFLEYFQRQCAQKFLNGPYTELAKHAIPARTRGRHLDLRERPKGSGFPDTGDRRPYSVSPPSFLLTPLSSVPVRMENNNNNTQQAVLDATVQLETSGQGPFDPAAHQLDPTFRLTRFADLKG